MIYIGIDPGQSGGLAAIVEGEGVKYTPMPTTDRDIWNWFNQFAYDADAPSACNATAVIERVFSSPQMGVSSSFTFGRGYGGLRMALIAAGIEFIDVTPQTWMKALGIPKRGKDVPQAVGKEMLRAKAQQMFPKLKIWNEPKSKGRQLAVADALMIAKYCKMTQGK